MDKLYIKTQIAMRQSEFPTDLKERGNHLPVMTPRKEGVINRLLASGVPRERFLWISFDDERLVHMSSDNLEQIIEAYREMYPDIDIASVYMFFDEIQLGIVCGAPL